VTSLPLQGIKVLDMSRILAGPLCTMLLGDLGADVIKVERPGRGDDTRGWGPPFDPRGESAYFLSCNRNKRSLTADLAHPGDLRLVSELVSAANVVVDNFLPGTLAKLGLDADEMLAHEKHLIWCTIGGFPDQPMRPGYDFAVQAESGWMSVTGEPAGRPLRTAVALIDVLTGKDAAIAILAALVGGERRSAVERRLIVTLAGTAAAALANVAQNALVSGQEAARWGNAHANLVPYQLFDTADRPIVIAVGSDTQWAAFAAMLGDRALSGDERLATNAGRVVNRDSCVRAVQAALRTAGASEWAARCLRVGVPVGEVRTVLEALSQVAASPLTGVPSSVGGAVHRPPPLLGEHSAEIRARGWG